jgi:phosphoglucosamine mutase
VAEAFKARQIEFVRAKVGDRYVLEELNARGWALGGEGSGHLLALDKHTTGDGLVSALQVLQAVQRSGQTLASLLGGLTLMPQVLLNVQIQAGLDWQHHAPLVAARDDVTRRLGEHGRVLIRASGTEPVLRVMVEAGDADEARRSAEQIALTVGTIRDH